MTIDTSPLPAQCAECGAPLGPAETCADLFNRMLALEWELIGDLRSVTTQEAFLDSPIGAVYGRAHFFAVGAYQLQHPSRLEAEAALGLHFSIGEVLAGRRSVAEVRSDNRRAYAGARPVLRKAGETGVDPALGPWPAVWAVTAADCSAVAPADYPLAVERFAATTVAAIDAVRSSAATAPLPPPRPAPPRRRGDRQPR